MGQRNGTYSAQVFRPVMNKKLTVARGYKEDEKVVCVSCEVCVYCWTKRRRIPDYYFTPNMQHARRQGSSYSLPILMCWSCVLHTSVISHVRSCGSEQVRCKRYRHRYVPVHLLCQVQFSLFAFFAFSGPEVVQGSPSLSCPYRVRHDKSDSRCWQEERLEGFTTYNVVKHTKIALEW